MPKYEFTWYEQRRTVIEAQDEEEAYEKLNDGGEDDSEFLGSDNYSCREVTDATPMDGRNGGTNDEVQG